MKIISAFGAGLLFAVGLVISGMTRPENIVGFLDFFGDWNPALLFVMIGAVGVYAAGYRLVVKRPTPIFSGAFELPQATALDVRLIGGSAAFGFGWGLGGFCPGPALVALGSGGAQAALFVAAMLLGVVLHRLASGNNTGDQTLCG